MTINNLESCAVDIVLNYNTYIRPH